MSNKQITNPFNKLFLIALLLLALPLAACGQLTDTAAAAPTEQQAVPAPAAAANNGVVEAAPIVVEQTAVENTDTNSPVDNTPDTVATADLSVDEIADLLFMREEEKLARDLYLAYYEMWGTPVFQNIAASEQAHMDALLTLINLYDLKDPAADNGPGEFSDPALQSLYNQLLTDGSQSAIDALYASAAVEEIDILDLKGSLALAGSDDIIAVYENLMAGSENHLRAFVSSWERQTGETYQPQRLNQDAYAEIMGGVNGNGSGTGNGQGGPGGNGQGGNGGSQGNNGNGQGNNGSGQGGNGKGNRGGGRGGNGSPDNGAGGPGGRGTE